MSPKRASSAPRAASHARVGSAPQTLLTAAEHRQWARNLWNRMNRDRDDTITREELNCDEFQEVIHSVIAPSTAGKTVATYARAEQNAQQVMSYCLRKADLNCDGILSFKEFESLLRALRNESQAKDSANLIFALFDLDCDQTIDQEEFHEIYRYFLGHHPTAKEFADEWKRLDAWGKGRANKKEYIAWLQTSKNPIFKQHAPPVVGEPLSGSNSIQSLGGAASPSGTSRAKAVWRPAPGLVPPRPSQQERDIPSDWNPRFAAKDPSEQNIAFRGNLRMKTYFSRPQSLPELRRFYATYQGFEKMRKRAEVDDDPNPRRFVSTDTVEMLRLPGRDRHFEGGKNPNARGEVFPWRDLTPRALKKRVLEPGTLTLRVPQNPPLFLSQGRDAPAHLT